MGGKDDCNGECNACINWCLHVVLHTDATATGWLGYAPATDPLF